MGLVTMINKENNKTKLLWTCIVGVHLQSVNNHYAKFEYKGIKTVGVTDYTQITQCKHSKGVVDVKCLKFNTPKNIIKYQMCTKLEVHTSYRDEKVQD